MAGGLAGMLAVRVIATAGLDAPSMPLRGDFAVDTRSALVTSALALMTTCLSCSTLRRANVVRGATSEMALEIDLVTAA